MGITKQENKPKTSQRGFRVVVARSLLYPAQSKKNLRGEVTEAKG